jgi:D-glycero-D-manno-heptose 1,7-bisphosphate phosphatase
MGRFVTKVPANQPQRTQSGQPMELPSDWPTVFPKNVVGLEREGVIIKDIGRPIKNIEDIEIIPGSLEAIRMLRLKGYKVIIINDQPGITKGLITQEEVEITHNYLMQIFGQSNIFSIDGMFFSTSDMKDDIYAKPNDGMFKRAQKEMGINWKGGYFVGHNLKDVKVSEKIKSNPILVKTGNWEETLKKLNTFSNRDLLKKTKIYNNLLEFAETLN